MRTRALFQKAGAFLALALSTTPAAADSLASGAAADLLTINDEFVIGLDEPTGLSFLPDGRFVVAERAGKVRLFTADGTELESPGTLDVSHSHGEKGLLNVVVHPDFAKTRALLFYYVGNGPTEEEDDTRVSSFTLDEDDKLLLGSERRLVDGIGAPANHDGGGLAVLGDYVFIGTGDTGSNTDAKPYDQVVGNYYPTCFTNLNGKILRVRLDGSIPADNPLVGKLATACGSSADEKPTGLDAARPEIFAWGFRNAFRVWADSQTGNLWVGHVGEVTFEAIHLIHAAGNEHAGWPFREGGEGFPKSECQKITPNVGDCVDPVYRCEQSDNKDRATDACPGDWGKHCDNPEIPNQCDSITGGVILSSCAWPEGFRGKYVFGDHANRRLWTLPLNEARDNVIGERENLATSTGGPVQFVENAGALYVVQFSGAKSYISKLTPNMTTKDCDPTVPVLSSEPSGTPPAATEPADAGGDLPDATSSFPSTTSSGQVSSGANGDTPADTALPAPGAATREDGASEAPVKDAGETTAPKSTASKASCDCAIGQASDSGQGFFTALALAVLAFLFQRRSSAAR